MTAEGDTAAELERAIQRYNEAWNAHDLDAIMSMHSHFGPGVDKRGRAEPRGLPSAAYAGRLGET